MRKSYIILIILLLSLSSCRVFNPTKMLRMGPFPEYSSLDLIKEDNFYRIAPFDNLAFSVLPNDGEQMIGGGNSEIFGNSETSLRNTGSGGGYMVDYDGTVKLPIFGRTPVEGMTERELEKMLEEKYSLFYNKPFIANLSVTNRKIFIFKGGSNSSVVNLSKAKMTIWELVAQSGGVGDAKAHRIKLIREIDNKLHVFLIDLSRIENKSSGNIVLQANDILYITPRNKFADDIMFALAPYLSLLSTIALIYTLIKR